MNDTKSDVVLLDLGEAVARFGRTNVAGSLGCTAPALANALRVKRMIFVRVIGDNLLYAFEISSFPGKGFCKKSSRGTLSFRGDISSILKKEYSCHEHLQVQITPPKELPILLSG